MNLTAAWNAEYIEAQYQRWKKEPHTLSEQWRFFFEGFELARSADAAIDEYDLQRECRGQALVDRYRELGHLTACLDPLAACPTEHPLLSLQAFGLTARDLERQFSAPQFSKSGRATLAEILQALKETYCRSIGVEFTHLQDPDEKQWLLERIEPVRNRPALGAAEKQRIFEKLVQAAMFEEFLNRKFIAVTRFSLEGGDALIPALDDLVRGVARKGCREIVLGMAHRGRLNVQAHVLNRPYEEIFAEFENCYNPDDLVGAGDVKYHNGYLADVAADGRQVLRIFLMNNPSHLESVDPVVEGFVRARQDMTGDAARRTVLPVLIHGDAAFAAQGVVAETLNMSQLQGYRTGGTLHLVINNQIGYTTLPENARSTRYSTDIAKMLMVPIFHVHGEDPEALVHVLRLAADYRWHFGKDAVIDLVCYRRYGHNEGDEPYFTQPLMYERIRQRPPLKDMYARRLIAEGLLSDEYREAAAADVNRRLDKAYESVHGSECPFPQPKLYAGWDAYHGKYSFDPVRTRVAKTTLRRLAGRLANLPEGFQVHPKLRRLIQKRLQAVKQGAGIDWAGAEALAFASLLIEGVPVRLSGQDSSRGTFSQRHSILFDTRTGGRIMPLNALDAKQAAFEVWDSPLAEVGVLGFEYGYATARPEALVAWEAQFGDFVNNAQSVIDLFVVSGEAKWGRLSGLVLLLPHGFEGLGPEHSSARPERFLQLCADNNIQVCNPSTPAQYFHLLRRQVKSGFRKPLVILTPKSLLRHPLAVSSLDELGGGTFEPLLDDREADAGVSSVLFCSGKIYYELLAQRRKLTDSKVALVRLEQLYPFAERQLGDLLQKYARAAVLRWVQEEPENMGAWQFVKPRLEALAAKPVGYTGRKAAASPATGFAALFKREQRRIIAEALEGRPET